MTDRSNLYRFRGQLVRILRAVNDQYALIQFSDRWTVTVAAYSDLTPNVD